jgi:hypothetical protein
VRAAEGLAGTALLRDHPLPLPPQSVQNYVVRVRMVQEMSCCQGPGCPSGQQHPCLHPEKEIANSDRCESQYRMARPPARKTNQGDLGRGHLGHLSPIVHPRSQCTTPKDTERTNPHILGEHPDLGDSRNIKLTLHGRSASIVLYKVIRSKIEHRLQYTGGALGNC